MDDLASNRKALAALLDRGGHRLLEAANGQAGLAVVRADRPDLVITDVLAGPAEAGLAADFAEADSAVDREQLELLGDQLSKTAEDLRSANVLLPGIAFLSKPFTAETLGRNIRSVLDQ